jgi:hypothetical protein
LKPWIGLVIVIPVLIVGASSLILKNPSKVLIHIANTPPISTVINKVQRIGIPANNAACLQELKLRDVEFKQQADFAEGNRCAVKYAVRLARVGSIKLDNAPLLTCGMAMQLTKFEKNTLQPTAKRLLGTGIDRIRHIGTYNCRSMRQYKGILSQHAFANAIDVSGFELADGRSINVERDWKGSESKSKFLKTIASKACKSFRVSVSPDSDANHFNHLHWDTGLYRSCG